MGNPVNDVSKPEAARGSGERLSAAGVICAFMEPNHMLLSVDDLHWHGVRYRGNELAYCERVLTLDALWEVEERLKFMQWHEYKCQLSPHVGDLSVTDYIHLTAEQKIEALAPVLRPLVEAALQSRDPPSQRQPDSDAQGDQKPDDVALHASAKKKEVTL